MSNGFKCILFDCDGVLVESEIIAMQVEIEEFRRLGLNISEDYYRAHLLGYSETEGVNAIRNLAAEQGQSAPPPDLLLKLSTLRKQKYLSDLHAVNGMDRFLKRYVGDVAIVSSSSLESVGLKLKIVGLSGFFDQKISECLHCVLVRPLFADIQEYFHRQSNFWRTRSVPTTFRAMNQSI